MYTPGSGPGIAMSCPMRSSYEENVSLPASAVRMKKTHRSRVSGSSGKEQIRSRSPVRTTPKIPSRSPPATIAQLRENGSSSKDPCWPMTAKTCLSTSTLNPGAFSSFRSMKGGKENVTSRNGSAASTRPAEHRGDDHRKTEKASKPGRSRHHPHPPLLQTLHDSVEAGTMPRYRSRYDANRPQRPFLQGLRKLVAARVSFAI